MEAMLQGTPSASESACSKKIKPRALIFKSNNYVFKKITELIETQFPEAEILYVTTGPAGSVLRVTKSIPFEIQDSSAQPFFTVE